MARKIMAIIKLQLPAGEATPGQPVGPALGQHGVNIMQFVKEYNARTANQVGDIVPVEILVYQDRSFTFTLKTSPATAMLKKAAGVTKGAKNPKLERAGKITRSQLRELAERKLVDLNAYDVESAMRMLEGSARSMGIAIVEG